MVRADMKLKKIIFLVPFLVFVLGGIAHAEVQTMRRATVIVPENAVVRGSEIMLGDIAQIASTQDGNEELVVLLRSISLGAAPAPAGSEVILGANILSALEKAQVKMSEVGYAIPRAVTVRRSGRELGADEVLASVRETIRKDKELDLQAREVSWDGTQVIPLGNTEIHTEQLGSAQAGKIPLRVEVLVEGAQAARFLATAIVDDWREVPVMRRTLERGMLINTEDVQLVRLNLFNEPADVVEKLNDAVGRVLSGKIAAGETIRKSRVDIPPVVMRGKQVQLRYQHGALTAVASVRAMEDGHQGQVIRVRNTNSQKEINAKVISEHEVEVTTR